MKKIKELTLYEMSDMFLMVSDVKEKITSKGNKPYINFVLSDGEDSIEGKLWNTKLEVLDPIKTGDVIKVRAKVEQWENNKQLNIERCRAVCDSDCINKDDFIKKAPVAAEEMYNHLISVANSFTNNDFKNLTIELLTKNKEILLYLPAAKSVHHNIKSGLLFHVYRMLQNAERMAEVYPNLNKELLFCGVILHDIGKIIEINSDEYGVVDDYTKRGKLLGHIVEGIKMIALTSKELNISDESELLIEHMIASHHFDPSMGAYAKPSFWEAELVHHLDMIDARYYMMNEVSQKLENGCFSERQFFLDGRQVYRPDL